MDVAIAVDGADADVESLWEWLREEPQLRGRISANSPPSPDGTMGAPIELIVALATSTGGTMTVLARAMTRWLIERERQRRSDVVVKVRAPDGRQVSVSAQRAADSEALLRTILEVTESTTDNGQVDDEPPEET